MNQLELYWNTVEKKKGNIGTLVKRKIKKVLGRTLDKEEFEDLFFTEVTRLAERVTDGLNTFESDLKIMSYLQRACYTTFKRSIQRESFNLEQNNSYRIDTYGTTEGYILNDFDNPDEEAAKTKNLYDEILRFLENYQSISENWFLETGIFKSYYINEYTFDALSEASGYSRSKCFNIVNKVGSDLEEHLRTKGYTLTIKKKKKGN